MAYHDEWQTDGGGWSRICWELRSTALSILPQTLEASDVLVCAT